jgi:ubiquinone/menaquinone biosynthesis C-methylase UbiE
MPVIGHDDKNILDFGCGIGHDLVGFLEYSNCRSVVGVDISKKALSIASSRIGFSDLENRASVYHLKSVSLPFETNQFDYIHSSGVLHHVPDLVSVLRELRRVLTEDGRIRLMVYNSDSIWRHLYVAYVQAIKNPRFKGAHIDDVFRKSTDGINCPISRHYSLRSFSFIANPIGFHVEKIGTSISQFEVELLKSSLDEALNHPYLNNESRTFLEAIQRNGLEDCLKSNPPGINLVMELIKN